MTHTDLIRPLRQLPEAVVEHLAAVVMSEMPAMPPALAMELRTAIATRTERDWMHVANELEWAERPGLAREILDALEEAGERAPNAD